MNPSSAVPAPLFNEAVVAEAQAVQDAVLDDLLGRISQKAAVVAAAPAGAGKSYFVGTAVGRLRAEGHRVALVAPTNKQAHSLVETVKKRNPSLPLAFVPARDEELPAEIGALPGVSQPKAKEAEAERAPLVVATIDKLADAFARNDLSGFDVLVMDEAYQADAARYYSVAGIAPTHLLVGDPGQLDPFSTVDDATFWRGGPEDPLQTAVGVLLRNHPATPHQFPITRRLDPLAVPVARCFYPDHPFDAAVRDGVRQLHVGAAGSGSRKHAVVDQTLDHAADNGWAHVVLPGTAFVTADLPTADLLCDLAQRLLERGARTRCEDQTDFLPLEEKDVAIGVSHNDQKDLVRVLLDSRGLRGVTVDTANRLQGLTFQVVLAWHPLAGPPATDAFHLDPGRLCVLLTRHRHACIVVGRETDRALLDGIPPATPGFLGWEPDPVLDGWDAHEAVFSLLEPHAVQP